MTFREALEKLKIIGQGWGEPVALTYSISVDEADPNCERVSIYMHVGPRCAAVKSYEAGFAELAMVGHVEGQEPEGEARDGYSDCAFIPLGGGAMEVADGADDAA